MKIHSRQEVWPGLIPSSSNGAIRPLLPNGVPYLVVHWVGTGRFTDPGDTVAELQAIERYSASVRKPWQYNYVIDGAGEAWEYAGRYVGAHSAGENHISVGVLLLYGQDESYTDEMISGLRQLIAHAKQLHWIAQNAMITPHKDMPGAATQCPGPIMTQWARIVEPWPDDDESEEEMRDIYILVPSGGWVHGWWPHLVIDGASVRVATSADSHPTRPCTDEGQYRRLCSQFKISLTQPMP